MSGLLSGLLSKIRGWSILFVFLNYTMGVFVLRRENGEFPTTSREEREGRGALSRLEFIEP